MQTWFEAKISYFKVTELGKEQKVTEQFLLDAVSFTDAEARITKLAQEFTKGEFAVKDIKQSNVAEVFPYDHGEWWWKAKIALVTIDEEAGREKRTVINYLVMANDINEAVKRIEESLSFMVIPFVVLTVSRSPICDVFPYELAEKAAEIMND